MPSPSIEAMQAAARSRTGIVRLIAAVAAVIAALISWLVITQVLSIELVARTGGPTMMPVGPAAVVLVSALACVAGIIVLAILETNQARGTNLDRDSGNRHSPLLAGPLSAAPTLAITVSLMALHLVTAAVFVPLASWSAFRKTQRPTLTRDSTTTIQVDSGIVDVCYGFIAGIDGGATTEGSLSRSRRGWVPRGGLAGAAAGTWCAIGLAALDHTRAADTRMSWQAALIPICLLIGAATSHLLHGPVPVPPHQSGSERIALAIGETNGGVVDPDVRPTVPARGNGPPRRGNGVDLLGTAVDAVPAHGRCGSQRVLQRGSGDRGHPWTMASVRPVRCSAEDDSHRLDPTRGRRTSPPAVVGRLGIPRIPTGRR